MASKKQNGTAKPKVRKSKSVQPNTAKPVGRPAIEPDVYEEILDRLANGEGLWKICSDPRMPHRGTVLRKAADDPAFCDKYARAMQLGVDCMFDDIERVARDGGRDIVKEDMGDGLIVERVDHENIARSRLIVDTLKWKASKIAPKKYGDKTSVELTGKDGGAIELSVAETLRQKRAERLRAVSE